VNIQATATVGVRVVPLEQQGRKWYTSFCHFPWLPLANPMASNPMTVTQSMAPNSCVNRLRRPHGSFASSFHPLWSWIWFAILLIVTPGPSKAEVEQVKYVSIVDPPDFSNYRSSIPLALMLLVVSPMIASIVLLIIRRHHYPMPGRGFSYLLGTAGGITVTVFTNMLISIYFPQGPHCGIQFLTFMLDSFIAIFYAVRGVMLVFRLEIMNYLQEMRWREEKKMDIEKRIMRGDADGMGGDANGNGETAISIDSDRDYAADGTLKNHGRWFIDRRRWTEPRRLLGLIAFIYAVVCTVMILMVVFDPDVDATDEALRQNGLLGPPPATSGPVFSMSFGVGPSCVSGAMKSMLCYAVMGVIIIPAGLWFAIMIHRSKKRKLKREQEKKEWEKKLNDTTTAAAADKDDEDEPDSPRNNHGRRESGSVSVGGNELNDSLNVKNEMVYCCVACAIAVLLLMIRVIDDYGTPYLKVAVESWMWLVSIVLPLRLSYTISRKHRQMIMQGRAESSCNSKRGKYDPNQYTKLAHHQPYYNLNFLLRSSHTYPVLLQFLQKEFSSENALFWTAVQEFTRFARKLERTIPNWNAYAGGNELSSMAGGSALAGSTVIQSAGTSFAHRRAGSDIALDTAVEEKPNALPSRNTTVNDLQLTSPTDASPSPCPPQGSPSMQRAPSSATNNGGTTLLTPPAPAASHANHGWLPADGSSTMGSAAAAHGRPPSLGRPQSSSTQLTRVISKEEMAQFYEDAMKSKEWALKIYNDYLDPSAMFEVNVPADEATQVAQQVELLRAWQPNTNTEPEPDAEVIQPPERPPFPLSRLYSQTCSSIFALMEKDSLRRFILTKEFQRLLEEADEQELARVEKQQDLADDTMQIIDRAVNMQHSHQKSLHMRTASEVSRAMAEAAINHHHHMTVPLPGSPDVSGSVGSGPSPRPFRLQGDEHINDPSICATATTTPQLQPTNPNATANSNSNSNSSSNSNGNGTHQRVASHWLTQP